QQEWASATEPGVGLEYVEDRYYDPAVGRFISQDPIGFAGGLNLYGYANANPVNVLDPTGRDGFFVQQEPGWATGVKNGFGIVGGMVGGVGGFFGGGGAG